MVYLNVLSSLTGIAGRLLETRDGSAQIAEHLNDVFCGQVGEVGEIHIDSRIIHEAL